MRVGHRSSQQHLHLPGWELHLNPEVPVSKGTPWSFISKQKHEVATPGRTGPVDLWIKMNGGANARLEITFLDPLEAYGAKILLHILISKAAFHFLNKWSGDHAHARVTGSGAIREMPSFLQAPVSPSTCYPGHAQARCVLCHQLSKTVISPWTKHCFGPPALDSSIVMDRR